MDRLWELECQVGDLELKLERVNTERIELRRENRILRGILNELGEENVPILVKLHETLNEERKKRERLEKGLLDIKYTTSDLGTIRAVTKLLESVGAPSSR